MASGGGCHLRFPGHIVTGMAVRPIEFLGGGSCDTSGGPATAGAAPA